MSGRYPLFASWASAELGEDVVPEHRFAPPRRWRFDFAIVRHRIALEVEGGAWTAGRHFRGPGILKDMEKYNTAACLGWRLIRVVPGDLMTRNTIDMLRQCIRFRG